MGKWLGVIQHRSILHDLAAARSILSRILHPRVEFASNIMRGALLRIA